MLARCITEELTARPNPESLVEAFGQREGAAILESSLSGGNYSRWSVYASDPVATVTIRAEEPGCPFDRLSRGISEYPRLQSDAAPVPYNCGWIGHITYEAGLAVERVRPVRDRTASPLRLRFSLYDAVALHDSLEDKWFAIAIDWPSGFSGNRRPVGQRLAQIKGMILHAAEQTAPDAPPLPAPTELRPSISKEQYLRDVARILEFIAAGDVYQVNLTQRFRARSSLSPLHLFRRLRQISPSSHSAYLAGDDFALISASPELFLRTNNAQIVTRPIKGTRPRSTDPILDRAFRADLESAEKDAAELAMIVDLARNDLGRICDFGSIRVTDPASTEHHPTVYHRVATVEGRLRGSATLGEILRATCPAGSVTGTPKIRATQIISALETTPRGPYCGSMGWIGLDGSLSLNVAIRTMLQRGSTVDFHAGGGIVADSVARDEYEEMMTKLSAMARAAGCVLPATEAPPGIVEASTT